ncbi:hypothetical protein [Paramicrobacterium agarici]|uniref:Uncharacterized protein n=1 Tax=Paramicrobacterium agarici TaxID=630514 RepID=A0A2A9DWW3_9MICO|nr:hypothetical protein [Microbacterium agarici]PFG31178.1 hypothetical protein ATJ78_2133 [Microbacterium agarici]
MYAPVFDLLYGLAVLLIVGVGIFVNYWVMRMAVRHGVQDATEHERVRRVTAAYEKMIADEDSNELGERDHEL